MKTTVSTTSTGGHLFASQCHPAHGNESLSPRDVRAVVGSGGAGPCVLAAIRPHTERLARCSLASIRAGPAVDFLAKPATLPAIAPRM